MPLAPDTVKVDVVMEVASISLLKVTEMAAVVSTAPDDPSVLFETTVGYAVLVIVAELFELELELLLPAMSPIPHPAKLKTASNANTAMRRDSFENFSLFIFSSLNSVVMPTSNQKTLYKIPQVDEYKYEYLLIVNAQY